MINRIHGILDGYGRTIQASRMYSQKGVRQLEEIVLGTRHETMILQQCVRQMMHLTGEIAVVDGELEADAAQNRDAKLLVSMPGVGPFVALLMAVEIDGISRFSGPKKLGLDGGALPYGEAVCQKDEDEPHKEAQLQLAGQLGDVRSRSDSSPS